MPCYYAYVSLSIIGNIITILLNKIQFKIQKENHYITVGNAEWLDDIDNAR